MVLETCDDVNLTGYNTLGLRSQAAKLLVFKERSELPALHDHLSQYERFFVLGGGSNVVLAERLRQTVLHVVTKGIRLLHETEQGYVVQAEAGENWHQFVQHCVERGWAGLENLALIPGTVGAAPVQNIGAYGVELEQRLHSVLAWHFPSAQLLEIPAQDCGFAYRDSRFKRDPSGTWLIVAVRFFLPRVWQAVLHYADLEHRVGQQPTPLAVFNAVCDIRRSKLPDPQVLGNAGSFFKNPVVSTQKRNALVQQWPALVSYPVDAAHYKLAAAWLIDQLGWKGKRLGPVGMHTAQALVMVNYGQARAQDIHTLAQAIKDDVQARYGVLLEQEPINVA